MERLRIGIVGLRFGLHHLRTFLNMDGVHVAAVADRNLARDGRMEAQLAPYGIRVYHDAAQMIESEPLDAIDLCIPPRPRESLIRQAAALGLPMFVEKPWASNAEQARRLAQICHAHGARVMVGFSFRFHPAIVRLHELIQGELGQPWLLNGDYVFDWVPPNDAWLWDPTNGNGFFNENSCHLIDAVCYLMGRPVLVTAEAASFTGAPSQDAAAVTLKFGSGSIATLTIGGIGVPAFRTFGRIDVVTQNGQARLNGSDHVWTDLQWATRLDRHVHSLEAHPERLGRTRYTDALEHFVACVAEGRKPTATIADGCRAVAVAQAIYESARCGQSVVIEE